MSTESTTLKDFFSYRRQDVLPMLGVILFYLPLLNFIFSYLYPHGEVSLIWLPSGIGLGVLLLFGARYWLAVFLGILLGYVLVLDRPWLISSLVSFFSNAMEAILGYWILTSWRFGGHSFDSALKDSKDFVFLLLAAALSALVASLTGCFLLNASGIYDWSQYADDVLHWWTGNMLGIQLMTPLMLVWSKFPAYWRENQRSKLELICYFGFSFLTGQIIFLDWFKPQLGHLASSQLMFLFISWGAIRFGLQGTLVVIVMTAIQGVIGSGLGLGLFSEDSSHTNMTGFWVYMLTLSIVGVLISTVIQKRKDSEEALAESEKRWKFALEGAGDGVWDWDMQTSTVVFSKGWKSMLGYEEHDVGISLSEWESRVHPDDMGQVMADIKAYLDGRSPAYSNEHRMLCKDGSWKWILDRGMVFNRAPDGSPMRMVGTHADITRHKLLESALKQNEEDLYVIFAQSPDGIVVFDDERMISHVNPAFCQISGLSNNLLIGATEQNFDEMMIRLCVDKSIYPATANLKHAVNTVVRTHPDSMTDRPQSDRGDHIEINSPEHHVLLRSFIDLDQKRLSRVMYFHDITAETVVDRMKTEFLSTAAHELRTPMSIIMGYSELLKQHVFDHDTQNQMIESIHEQSQSIVNLLNELLDLARIEARAGKAFNMEFAQLGSIVEKLADTFVMPGDARRVKLLPMPELPEMLIDREKIGQALKNCLSNAFKFSSEDQEVVVEVLLHGQEVRVLIRDHGIGMTQEQLSRIFERFYRADTSGKVPGTGLGMSLIKEIIEHHHGRVVVESEYGKGTVVALVLPLNRVE